MTARPQILSQEFLGWDISCSFILLTVPLLSNLVPRHMASFPLTPSSHSHGLCCHRHSVLKSQGKDEFLSPCCIISTAPDSWRSDQYCHTGVYFQQGPRSWSIILCVHCLKLLDNFIFNFVFKMQSNETAENAPRLRTWAHTCFFLLPLLWFHGRCSEQPISHYLIP